ncbi:MAG: FAD-dependent monooxygenase [Treponema sp.]|nr:FAD-dependent monooxygenase [Treponema sp.]
MVQIITVTVSSDDVANEKKINSLIRTELAKKNIRYKDISVIFEKKSVDARHGKVKVHLRYKVYIDEKPADEKFEPKWKTSDGKKSVIIVGSGPAGLFGALRLLEYGIKPVIIERGKETSERKKDIASISTKHIVDGNSNYCFGEGGAGTFSDGKLYTRSNKRGNIAEVLQIFNYFGADKKILTDAHPHIGTDRLPQVINSMRNKIIELGGEVHFNCCCNEFLLNEKKEVTGIKAVDFTDGSEKCFYGDAVVLATGHSATDIYKLIGKIAPDALEAKTFAAGVRVEHPREIIDGIQFHNNSEATKDLGAAEYRLVTQVDERGVYSFCMCPGGFVVPSSSEGDGIVVNGMSSAARNSKWSNSAIVVEIRPEDIPEEFKDQAQKLGCVQMAGLLFRTEIERLAKENGEGQAAPAQRLIDFLNEKKSVDFPPSSYTPGLVSSELQKWLPDHISSRLKKAFYDFNKSMNGFVCEQAVLIAPETRTSTPVRIVRNKDSGECTALKNLFPCGEGSGYSGGIVSSAMDGLNICKLVVEKILN